MEGENNSHAFTRQKFLHKQSRCNIVVEAPTPSVSLLKLFCHTLLHRHCRMFVQEWWFTVWPTGCLLYIFLVDGHPECPASSKDVTPCLNCEKLVKW